MNNDADSVNPDTHKFYFDVPGVKAANFGAFTHDYVSSLSGTSLEGSVEAIPHRIFVVYGGVLQ